MSRTLSARHLGITLADNTQYWHWKQNPEYARFTEVAELLQVPWLEINGLIGSTDLTQEKLYGVYLIYKLDGQVSGLGNPYYQTATIDYEGTKSETTIHLDAEELEAYADVTGWNQIKLGEFYNKGLQGNIFVKLQGSEGTHWKRGLTVAGIEFREVDVPSSDLQSSPVAETGCILRARDLGFTWGKSLGLPWEPFNDDFWSLGDFDYGDEKFPEVATCLALCWLDINGFVDSNLLSDGKVYGVYLIYKIDFKWAIGFDDPYPMTATVEFNGTRKERHISLDVESQLEEYESATGWNQIKIGEFRNIADQGIVFAKLQVSDISRVQRKLIVAGMEFRQVGIDRVPDPQPPPAAAPSSQGKNVLSARDLSITDGDNTNCWSWKENEDGDERFPEVAELVQVRQLEIKGWFEGSIFKSQCIYELYLIYRLDPEVSGLGDPYFQRAILESCGNEKETEIQLDSEELEAYKGGNGWNQIKIGEFYCKDGGDTGETLNVMILGSEDTELKKGLIVAGIELRETDASW